MARFRFHCQTDNRDRGWKPGKIRSIASTNRDGKVSWFLYDCDQTQEEQQSHYAFSAFRSLLGNRFNTWSSRITFDLNQNEICWQRNIPHFHQIRDSQGPSNTCQSLEFCWPNRSAALPTRPSTHSLRRTTNIAPRDADPARLTSN